MANISEWLDFLWPEYIWFDFKKWIYSQNKKVIFIIAFWSLQIYSFRLGKQHDEGWSKDSHPNKKYEIWTPMAINLANVLWQTTKKNSNQITDMKRTLASIFEIFIVWVGTQESLLKFLQFCDILANTFQLDAKFTASFSKASIEF